MNYLIESATKGVGGSGRLECFEGRRVVLSDSSEQQAELKGRDLLTNGASMILVRYLKWEGPEAAFQRYFFKFGPA